ncbi:RnfABCDGE type electron transport complex subunit B [Catenibacillus scindens]|uniref:RnfABCDGE type electron transport complex subunit B n=1 Tax=Catenibacillus scindens TaxID=673271 RepID=UPI003207BCEA
MITGVVIVVIIGLVAGLILSVASIVFAVPVDEKQEAVRAALPGANCGACGFSGCDGYAKALAEGSAEIGLCSPGGEDVANECAAILGKTAGNVEKKVALVRCAGHSGNVSKKTDYDGVNTCQAVSMMYGGDSACAFGCLGYGDCIDACPENAISLCSGAAVVNPDLCVGCGLCAKVCPKGVIAIVPAKAPHHVMCVNRDKGALTRKICKSGCIGCMKCVKTCPEQAITVENNHAAIDYDKCTGCGQCAGVCPVKAIC